MLALLKHAGFVMLLWCALIPLFSFAQEKEPRAKHITFVPFTVLTGGVVILHATLDNNPDTLNFVLDTGSGGISLDSATCEKLHIPKEKSNVTIRGIAGIRAVEYAYKHRLNLKGISVDALDFHINDYDILSSVYGLKIDGIVGYSFLRRYLVVLDYEKLRMEVLTNGSYKYRPHSYIIHPRVGNIPIQTIAMKERNDITSEVYFDTGAGLCLLVSERFAEDSAMLWEDKKMYPTFAQGLGGKAEMQLTTFKQIRFGPYRFRHVPTYVFSDPYNATSYPVIKGLIGNDLLRRFHVVLNYAKKEIALKPNRFYRDSFDYSYTGLGMYLVDNKIVILDIMEDSPADAAGLQVGDVVVGINKDFTNDIQTYKALLQTAGKTQSLMVQRKNAGILTLKLKVRSIR